MELICIMAKLKAEILNGKGIIAYEPKKSTINENYSKENLRIAKENKIKEIKESWLEAENGPCHTGIICEDTNEELIIQYKAFDRDIWAKKVLGIALEKLEAGVLRVVHNINTSNSVNELPVVISQEEAIALSLGTIPPRVFNMIKNYKLQVRDYYNKFHSITVGQLQQAAFKQNLQMEKDLYRKWSLEMLVNSALSVEQVNDISWDMKLN